MTMKRKGSSQKPHLRRSSKGKLYRAGKGHVKRHVRPAAKTAPVEVSQRERKQIFQEELNEITADLKKSGHAKIPGVAILRVKHKKATPRRVIDNPFKPGEKMTVKAKPARKIIKIKAVKVLKEKID
jgi:nucleoid DNA-binding protein